MWKVLWATKQDLVSNESGDLIYELIKDPWKITSIHSKSHNIGIDKFIKIRSDNKLKKFYLKGIVYQRGFHLVLHIVGKDHTVWFHDELGGNYIYEKEKKEKQLEKFSSFDLQSCDRHTGSSLYIYTKIK